MRRIILIAISLALMVGIVNAQDDLCLEIIETALDAVSQECEAVGSSQACYAHDLVEADFSPDVAQPAFGNPGDIVDVGSIQVLRLSPLDTDARTWGLVLLQLNAGDLPEQTATLVAFGDVELRNQAQAITVQITASNSINVRSEPSTSSAVVGSLATGETVAADGRLEDGSWLRITRPDSGSAVGWVFAELVSADSDINALPVRDSTSLSLYPMQAFDFQAADGSPCTGAPPGGVIAQSADEARVTLVVNRAELQLRGTVFLEAPAGGPTTVSVVEGSVRVRAFDGIQIVPAGARVSVPHDGPPGSPEPYDETVLRTLPLSVLERPVTLVSALTPDQIAKETECTVVALNDSNLRGGPGTAYAVQGRLPEGETANPVGQVMGTDNLLWWQLSETEWIRADLVRIIGNCDSIPIAEFTPQPASSSASPDAFYRLEACLVATGSLRSGNVVQFSLAGGSWPTQADAREALSDLTGNVSVDGVALPVFVGTITWGENNYGVAVRANWTATSGSHTVSGSSNLFGGQSASCTVSIG